MRTNVEIDDDLMKKAMRANGSKTKRATIEDALRLLVQTKAQGRILRWFGKVDWDGDLKASRRNRISD